MQSAASNRIDSLAPREKRTAALLSVTAAITMTGLKLAVAITTGSLGILSDAIHSSVDLAGAAVFRIGPQQQEALLACLRERLTVDAALLAPTLAVRTADDRVVAVTLTGSEGAGIAVAEQAGRHLKKVVLELGGSDPFVVMPSADLEQAAKVATTARCQNNGQSCIAAKRFIVHRDVYDRFAEAFVDAMASQTVGDPMDDDTKIGPLASEDGREDVEAAVADAVDNGAKVLCGGERPDQPGWWYPPTVVAGTALRTARTTAATARGSSVSRPSVAFGCTCRSSAPAATVGRGRRRRRCAPRRRRRGSPAGRRAGPRAGRGPPRRRGRGRSARR